jgi:hypothetical protein
VPTQPPIQWVPWALSLGVKWQGRETGPSLQLLPKSRIRWPIDPLPLVLNWFSRGTTSPLLHTRTQMCFFMRCLYPIDESILWLPWERSHGHPIHQFHRRSILTLLKFYISRFVNPSVRILLPPLAIIHHVSNKMNYPPLHFRVPSFWKIKQMK